MKITDKEIELLAKIATQIICNGIEATKQNIMETFNYSENDARLLIITSGKQLGINI
jgi:hypothetical protein